MSQRIYTFDLVRVICMLYIIGIWHMTQYTSMYSMQPWGNYITYAVLGTFMFISGYLLSGKYKCDTLHATLTFYQKRCFRVIPLFALGIFFYLVQGKASIVQTLFSLTGLSCFIPPQMGTLWFISMIICFYWLYPLIFRIKYLSIIIFAIIAIAHLLTGDKYIDERFLFYFPCFVLGVFMKDVYDVTHIKNLHFLLIFSIAILITCFDQLLYSTILAKIGISILGVFVLMYMASHILPKSFRLIKVIEYISYASMCAYIFHRQLISIVQHIYMPEDGLLRLAYMYTIVILIVIFGWWIQFLYNKLLKLIKI